MSHLYDELSTWKWKDELVQFHYHSRTTHVVVRVHKAKSETMKGEFKQSCKCQQKYHPFYLSHRFFIRKKITKLHGWYFWLSSQIEYSKIDLLFFLPVLTSCAWFVGWATYGTFFSETTYLENAIIITSEFTFAIPRFLD